MSLRRVVLALAVLFLFVGVASAQIIPTGALSCAVSASAPSLRAESKAELTGDLLIQCSGGNTPPIPTNQVPGVDITVSYGTPIMSRQGTDGSGNVVTDALLLIDDPQSLTAAQAVAPGYGASAPLVVCLPIVYPPSGGYGSTENPACLTYGNNLVNGYYVATNSSAGGTAAANAYPGVLTGAN